MFVKGKYKNFTSEEIELDLQSQGYSPLLIAEKPNDRLESHVHSQNHIIVVVSGFVKVKLKDKEILMEHGDQITINSSVKHGAHFGSEGCNYYWIEY